MMNAPQAIHAAGGSAAVPALVYMTYNRAQTLELDKEPANVRVATLVRLILRCHALSSVECDTFLDRARSLVVSLSTQRDKLIEVALVCLPTGSDVVICVDECRSIGVDCAKLLASVLGTLACAAHRRAVRCTVLLSSLESASFVTKSERKIEPVRLPPPTTAMQWVIDHQFPTATDEQRAMIAVTGGCHFRSLVTACAVLKAATQITVEQLALMLQGRLNTTLSENEVVALRRYICDCVCQGAGNARVTGVEADISALAVPPVVVYYVFAEADAPHKHPAQRIFAASAFVGAEKQLEHCGMHYDRFRALYGLPVVPHGIAVIMPPKRHTR
jgi:hypothetical protein